MYVYIEYIYIYTQCVFLFHEYVSIVIDIFDSTYLQRHGLAVEDILIYTNSNHNTIDFRQWIVMRYVRILKYTAHIFDMKKNVFTKVIYFMYLWNSVFF